MKQYEDILAQAPSEPEALIAYLSDVLPDLWCYEYETMTYTIDYPYPVEEIEINKIPLGNLNYLYDMGDAYDIGYEDNPRVESRLVVVYGHTQPPKTKRDTTRMQGFIQPSSNFRNGKYDKGHFISHQGGGGLDINLFFQRRDINRGWSARGKVYRQMERYCAQNVGTFCFSRPFYTDRSWHPTSIEYGLVKANGTLWIEQFENTWDT